MKIVYYSFLNAYTMPLYGHRLNASANITQETDEVYNTINTTTYALISFIAILTLFYILTCILKKKK